VTHFIGAVVVPASLAGQNPDPYFNSALAKFDEDLTVERWVSRADTIADVRKGIENYRDGAPYTEYLADPDGYAAKHRDAPGHLAYLSTEFPQKLAWTDEQCYAAALEDYEPEDVREDGAVRHTYNPDSKWDWWTLGGRWTDIYGTRQGESVGTFLDSLRDTAVKLAAGENCNPHKGDPDANGEDLPWYFPHNILTTDGTWHEIGSTGWFGFRSDAMTEAEWVEVAIKALGAEDAAASVYYIDFHI
jgi:hypothetical protein